MKAYIKVTLLILATLVSFVACRDNDDDITPSGNYSPIRGGFPQGTSEYDTIINNIKNEYGVYLLYKNVTEEDMNRTWISAGTGDIYVAGDSTERAKGSWDLPEEHLPYYVDFFNDYIFPNISKEFANSTFPIKIYMINNLRTEPRDYGEENKVESGTDTIPNKIIKLGEFDNWAISFPDSIVDALAKNDKVKTEKALKQMRCVFMINVIKNSILKGDLSAPEGFWDDYSMYKSSTCIDGNHDDCDKVDIKDKESENGLYTLGYIDVLEETFGTGRNGEVIKPITHPRGWLHPDYWTVKVNPTCDLFEAYIMNAMWFTPEEFHERYNTTTNTKIKDKYDLVVNHIKDFGVDLVGIAHGNKEQQPE